MRQSVEEYVTRCDHSQRRKDGREFRAPLGEVEEPTAISGDRNGHYGLMFTQETQMFVNVYRPCCIASIKGIKPDL
jgi:hypothetical protein